MDADAVRLALTGALPWVILIGSALSLPVSFLLLSLYRSAVRKGMRALAGNSPPAPLPAPKDVPSAGLLFEELTNGGPITDAGATAIVRRGARGGWPLAAVYACAGAGYALVMTVTERQTLAGPFYVPAALAIESWTYLWPTVLTVVIVAGYDSARRWQIVGGYFAVFGMITIGAVGSSSELEWLQLPLYWVIRNGPPTMLLTTFLLRPIRAVGPLVLAFMLLVTLGSPTLLALMALDYGRLRAVMEFFYNFNLGVATAFYGLVIAGAIAFAAVGWPLLHWIGRRYQARKVSDQSLTIDSLFIVFGIVQSISFAFEGTLWVLTGLVAFGAYKVLTLIGFRRLARPGHTPRTLLLLRVFRLGKRSERLFDRLRTHWQPVGNIAMIAGPDLATSTVEPHEFLDFIGGRLGRQFVTDAGDLERRVAAMDNTPDPDGRHRIHEFFCRADTWQMTMQRLAATSDAVVMDLRSFTPKNDGCLYELGRLVDGVDLGRVVFLVDGTTRRDFLDSTMAALWAQASASSPNRRVAAPTVRIYGIDSQSERTVIALMAHLLAAAPAR
jgi:hypothetical protein